MKEHRELANPLDLAQKRKSIEVIAGLSDDGNCPICDSKMKTLQGNQRIEMLACLNCRVALPKRD